MTRTARQTQSDQWRRTRGARHAARRARTKEPLAADRRLRSAARPEDVAFYACDCGHGFGAAPSTTVACPRCGTSQAW
jgi:hypothetical protein